jgi:hypothetical protein
MTCFCKRRIGDEDRRIDVALEIAWADERGDWQGVKTFCSFSCLASWAFEKATQHDARAVISPPERFEPAKPVIDTRTETLLR